MSQTNTLTRQTLSRDNQPAGSLPPGLLRWPEAGPGIDRANAGGKAMNLAVLTAHGFPVPAWCCVSALPFDRLYDTCPSLIPAIQRLRNATAADILTVSEALRGQVAGQLLSAEEQGQLNREIASRFSGPVAVRSSANDEDSAQYSFAGQMSTHLNVLPARVAEQVVDVLLSAFNPNALAYRQRFGLFDGPIRSGVIIQEMVDSQVSGVLFTRHPESGDAREMLLVAGYGLGDGIVSGSVDADTYVLDARAGHVLRRHILDKEAAIGAVAEGGTGRVAVEAARRSRETLTGGQIARLWQLGKRVAEVFGKPQDIEWAIDPQGQVWLLQARAITTLPKEATITYDNSNIVESFPGICSPLTYSIARHGYETVFRQSALAQGMPPALVAAYPEMHGALLGYVQGRIYYNLNNWYRRFDNIPGAHRRIRAMEQALGLTARTTAPEKLVDYSAPRLTFYRIRAWVRRAKSFLFLGGRIRRYLTEFERQWQAFEAIDLAEISYTDLLKQEGTLISRLLSPYIISIANDGFAQVFYRALEHFLVRAGFVDPAGLMNGLLCGQKEMASVDPVRSLYALAALAGADASLSRRLDDPAGLAAVWQTLAEDSRYPDFYRACCEHIRLYKDRVIGELKIESATLDEEPQVLLAMVRNVLNSGRVWSEREAAESAVRAQAESTLQTRLAGRPLFRALIRYTLGRTRSTVADRENLRLARTRGMGMVRRIYREIGRRFVRDGVIGAAADIVFLTREDIAALIHGCSPHGDVLALIAQRKRELAHYQNTSLPERFSLVPPIFPAALDRLAAARKPQNASSFQGLGCSGGVATARAKVFKSPDGGATINGEILVAPSTDPAWVFLMVAASGLISEKGSALSHTAIVGRELGIPTIVGVPDATSLLNTGDVVTMDGGTGEVFINERLLHRVGT